ncbi:unnamed protein product, partial [Ixodes pacificus]
VPPAAGAGGPGRGPPHGHLPPQPAKPADPDTAHHGPRGLPPPRTRTVLPPTAPDRPR